MQRRAASGIRNFLLARLALVLRLAFKVSKAGRRAPTLFTRGASDSYGLDGLEGSGGGTVLGPRCGGHLVRFQRSSLAIGFSLQLSKNTTAT